MPSDQVTKEFKLTEVQVIKMLLLSNGKSSK